MLKSALLAGLLVTGSSATQMSAASPIADVFASPMPVKTAASVIVMSSSAEQRCYDEAETWLPGALQIENRGRPTSHMVPGGQAQRAPAPVDCAVV